MYESLRAVATDFCARPLSVDDYRTDRLIEHELQARVEHVFANPFIPVSVSLTL